MKLINVRTYALEEFSDESIPLYAILSHTWETEEVLFRDMENLALAKSKRGFRKIEFACKQAHKDYLSYVWVDTCCIDKSSSAELQEAINSMYRWYENAEYCYAYLEDIFESCPFISDNDKYAVSPFASTGPSYLRLKYPGNVNLRDLHAPADELAFWQGALMRTKWFTRGWTLQELIAPKILRFFGCAWNFVGDREELAVTISQGTGIESEILCRRKDVQTVNIAQRMSWFGLRKTSRIEDQAYSLLGLFGVNMPMLYGEGNKAFLRLQEQILRSTNDQTILAWTGSKGYEAGNLLAGSPADFIHARSVVQYRRPESFEVTNRGLRIVLPLMNARADDMSYKLAALDCRYADDLSEVLALPLKLHRNGNAYHISSGRGWRDESAGTQSQAIHRLRHLKPDAVQNLERRLVEITWTPEEEREENSSHGVTLWLRVVTPLKIAEAKTRSTFPPPKFYCRYSSQSAVSDKVPYLPRHRSLAGYEPVERSGMGALLTGADKQLFYVGFGFTPPNQSEFRIGDVLDQFGVSLRVVGDRASLSRMLAEQFTSTKGHQLQHGVVSARLQLNPHLAVDANLKTSRSLNEDVIECAVTLLCLCHDCTTK